MKDSRIWSSMLTGTRCGVCSMGYAAGGSDVEVTHVECVLLDELPPRLDLVAHQGGEDLVGLVCILDLDLEQRARLGVHGRLPELRRVHLAETLVALDLEALARGGHDAVDGAADAEEGLRLLPFAEAIGRLADGGQLARDAARFLELRRQHELTIEDVAVGGPVGARGSDE